MFTTWMSWAFTISVLLRTVYCSKLNHLLLPVSTDIQSLFLFSRTWVMFCMLLLVCWESWITICGHSFTNHYPGCASPDPSYGVENSTNMKLKVGSVITEELFIYYVYFFPRNKWFVKDVVSQTKTERSCFICTVLFSRQDLSFVCLPGVTDEKMGRWIRLFNYVDFVMFF